MGLTQDEALLLAFHAELDEQAPSTIPRQAARTPADGPQRIDRETKEEK